MKVVLNIGCGNLFTPGTDFVDIYPMREDVLKCNIDTDPLPYPDETFDEVYSQAIFEHLTNPGHYMSEAKRVLKPGGKLTIITDNACYFGWYAPMASMPDHRYTSAFGPDDRHYMRFTHHHLENWARKFGFSEIEVAYEHCPLGVRLVFLKQLMKLLLPKNMTALHIELTAYK